MASEDKENGKPGAEMKVKAKTAIGMLKSSLKGRTKCANGIESIGILDTVQLDTAVVPSRPFSCFPELLLGTPGHIVDDTRYRLTTTVGDEVYAMLGGHRLKEG